MNRIVGAAAGLALGVTGAGAALAQQAEDGKAARSFIHDGDFDRDRQAILGMAGDFDVKFDFIETVSLDEAYEPAERKVSGGTEMVRVLEDTGDFISLQHTLVMHMEEMDQAIVVKHWRQDWQYEPETVLDYQGLDLWVAEAVPAEARDDAWSQTVYQVDDSPRYAALAEWTHDGKISTWEPDVAWRPLPRRDDTTRDDYQVIAAVNRHTVAPWAWWHEQDNSKQIIDGETTRELVREVGVNSYVRTEETDFSAGEEYWDKTGAFWAGVRAEWTRMEQTGRMAVHDNAEGEHLYMPILEIAAKVEGGDMSADAALDEARALMRRQVDTGQDAERIAGN